MTISSLAQEAVDFLFRNNTELTFIDSAELKGAFLSHFALGSVANPMITSANLADQNPDGLDAPKKVVWAGITESSPGGEVSIAPNGDITFNEPGYYIFSITMTLGRDTNVGQSKMLVWLEAGGVAITNSLTFNLDSNKDKITMQYSDVPYITGGTISVMFARNSINAGANDGGLKIQAVSAPLIAAGAPSVPSAVISIARLE